ncbi:hypothetical protein FQZ97_1219200 [compost metagenome]
MMLVHFEGQQGGQLGVLFEHGKQARQAFRFMQGLAGQAQSQGLRVLGEVRQAVFEHAQVKAGGPAQTLDPG